MRKTKINRSFKSKSKSKSKNKSKKNRTRGGGKDDKVSKQKREKSRTKDNPYANRDKVIFISKGLSLIPEGDETWKQYIRWWSSDEELKTYLKEAFDVYTHLGNSFIARNDIQSTAINNIQGGLNIGPYLNWDNEKDAKELRHTFYFHLVSYIACHYTELIKMYSKNFIDKFGWFLENHNDITGVFRLLPDTDIGLETCLKNYPNLYDRVKEKWKLPEKAAISNTIINTYLTEYPECIYGEKCRRKHNQDHVNNYSHPK